ncbi:MAG: fumarylacetoacetate hydrolase family protein, partial [Thermoguttaceae bacterium]
MRLITYYSPDGPKVAALRDGQYVELNRADTRIPADIKAFLAKGPEAIRLAKIALAAGEPIPSDLVRPGPPVPQPEKIICIGLNYADHARETGAQPPSEPVVFCKFSSAALGDGEPIVLPRVSAEVDFEAELVAVIGLGGRHIPRQDALRHVAGYCCGNDVSARDWQMCKPGAQWLLGKTFDTFAPFGPAIVTADEIPNPHDLGIQLRLNGHLMQKSSTAQLIFPVDQLISQEIRLA